MKTLDVVFQKPFFPVYDVLSRFPGDPDEGSSGSGNDQDPASDKPVPDKTGGKG